MTALTQLTSLNLSSAAGSLPRPTRSLTSLSSDNDIGPDGARPLAALTRLSILDMSQTAVYNEAIEHLLLALPALRKLSAHRNNTVGPLKQLLSIESVSVTDLRDYVTTLHREAGGFRRVKLVLLGHEGAGKTTLKEALKLPPGQGDVSAVLRKRPSTLGIAADPAAWPCGEVSFSIWDLSGHPEYSSANQYFGGEEGALYVVVVSPQLAETPAEQLRQWLSLLEAKLDRCRLAANQGLGSIVVLMTGGDLADVRKRRLLLRQDLAIVCADFTALPLAMVDGEHCRVLDYLGRPECVDAVRKRLSMLGRQLLQSNEKLILGSYESLLSWCHQEAERRKLLKPKKPPILRFDEVPSQSDRTLRVFDRSGSLIVLKDLGVVVLEPQWLFGVIASLCRRPSHLPGTAVAALRDIEDVCRLQTFAGIDAQRLLSYLGSIGLVLPIKTVEWLFPSWLPSLDQAALRTLERHWGAPASPSCLGFRLAFPPARLLPPGLFPVLVTGLLKGLRAQSGDECWLSACFVRHKEAVLLCRQLSEEKERGQSRHYVDLAARGNGAIEVLRLAAAVVRDRLQKSFPGLRFDWEVLCSNCLGELRGWPVESIAPYALRNRTLEELQCASSEISVSRHFRAAFDVLEALEGRPASENGVACTCPAPALPASI